MYIRYSKTSLVYNHQYEVFNGQREVHQDQPQRLEKLLESLAQGGYDYGETECVVPRHVLSVIHDNDYLTFLQCASEQVKSGDILFPSIFTHKKPESKNILAQLGYYSNDMYTPLHHNSYNAALASASVAYDCAQLLLANQSKFSYAVCRPSGHHAGKRTMSGYCFLNNAAVAAQTLVQSGKVAILDVDFHHGNGTQEIFYDRSDVLTVSIHADPQVKFPFYAGFAQESGVNKGEEFNLNIPLPLGTNNDQYHIALQNALRNIKAFNPSYLVLSLGFDTHEADPIGGFLLTTDYYTKMALTIKAMEYPIVVVQEGGYKVETLGSNILAFMDGFTHSSAV